MKVLYRLTSIPSINKIRPVEGTKIDLIRLCLDSFVEGFSDIEPFVHFIVDKPTVELTRMCQQIPFKHTLETLRTEDWNSGNIASFYRQVDLASEADDYVMFLEDDYFFLPNVGEIIMEGLGKADFVSPYHHPEVRTLSEPEDGWQKIESTTLTFATHSSLVDTSIMKAHGWADEPMWKELTQKHTLVQAVPSLATHMETPYLAPSMRWQLS